MVNLKFRSISVVFMGPSETRKHCIKSLYSFSYGDALERLFTVDTPVSHSFNTNSYHRKGRSMGLIQNNCISIVLGALTLTLLIMGNVEAGNSKTEILHQCVRNPPPLDYQKFKYTFRKCMRDRKVAYENYAIPKNNINGFTIKNSKTR